MADSAEEARKRYIVQQFKGGRWRGTFWTNTVNSDFKKPMRVGYRQAQSALKFAVEAYPKDKYRIYKRNRP